MDLLNPTNPTLLPGQRLLETTGYEAAEKYPMPRDCVAPIFDRESDYLYIKTTDTNGGVSMRMFHLEEEPIPKFDPKMYVTTNDFRIFKEEMLNAVNSIQQSVAGLTGNSNRKPGTNNNQQLNKPNNEQHQPTAGVQ